MQFSKIFEKFVVQALMTVLARVGMEHVLAPDVLDRFFEEHAEHQYTRELLFSTVVDLMNQVVFRIRPSIHAAYQNSETEIGVSVKALYDKISHTEPQLLEKLVRHTSAQLAEVIDRMGGQANELLPGYHVKVLDGNHLAGTEHRLKPLRGTREAVLPGQTLVVLDTRHMLVTDVVCCEDAYTQERALLEQLLPRIQPKELWIEDRNFCTTKFLFGVAGRQAYFLVRQHRSTLDWEATGERRAVGRVDSGKVFEQAITARNSDGTTQCWRRITLVLDKKTRDGDQEIHLLSNVPKKVNARKLANLYRKRWKVETAFLELTKVLRCEINTLAHPPAALFGFCLALLAYNVVGLARASLRAVHGAAVDEKVSSFYIADEIAGTYHGMMIAVPSDEWVGFQTMGVRKLAATLKNIARQASLRSYRRHVRGPKKPRPKRKSGQHNHHVSTSRVLKENAGKT